MNGHNAEYSMVHSKYIVMPHHSNPTGLLFGGVLMSWIDVAAAMVAEKHSGKDVATVQVEQINFSSPIVVGEHVSLHAKLISTGNSSMRITVTVSSEDVKTCQVNNSTQVTLTFVAIDEKRKSSAVPALIPS